MRFFMAPLLGTIAPLSLLYLCKLSEFDIYSTLLYCAHCFQKWKTSASMQILLDTQKCYGSSYPWSCPTALLVKKPRKKYSQLLLSATCNPDLLPSVTNSHWPPIYSNTDLVPGTTATIECFEGFHFHGTPVAINTPVPTLPTTTAPPIPISREFLKHF